MPYSVSTAVYSVSEPLPQNLSHKPVYAMPYEPFDGITPAGTDAKYLSVGLAQYDEKEVSAKVMRHTSGQWSPQAEELPVHRVIDLAVFVAKSLFDTENGALELPGGLFLNQKNCVKIQKETRSITEQAAFDDWLNRNESMLKERFNLLAGVLDELRRRGKI